MNIKKRLLPAALIVVVTLGCILLSRPTRLLFVLVLGIASAFELERVLLRAGFPVSKELMCVYITLQCAMCWARLPVAYMIVLYAVCAFAAMFRGVLSREAGAERAMGDCFALVWPFGFYAVMLHAAASDLWLPVFMTAVLGAWACDSMALIGGKAFGRHKLAPLVSPNKTWEGAVIGGVSAVLAGWLISLILESFYPVPVVPCIIVTFAASCFGQIGDLAASLIKRRAGVKDYGSLLPEHGGVLDKTDSMLFAVPAAYLGLYITSLI